MRQFDEEDQEFGEDFLSEEDPSILHFLLAGGDEVRTAASVVLLHPSCLATHAVLKYNGLRAYMKRSRGKC